jgi:flagellar basal-body rod protein FlgG
VLAYKLKDVSVGLQIVQRIGVNNPGVKIGENYVDYTQGSFRVTDNVYDLALSGDGFFAIEFTNKGGETSTKYTRAGSFTLNQQGYLVTKDGDYVLNNQNRRIQLNPNLETKIVKNGTIYQNDVQVAQIQVADFEDYNYLERYGETLFQPVEGARLTQSNASVTSGVLEMSNVSTVMEMVNLINITRAYEANQKLMQTHDQTLDIAVNQVGKI